MSWSFSVHPTPADDFPDAVEAARKHYEDTVVPGFAEEQKQPTREQMRAAAAAASAVVVSGAVGDRVLASLSGHANAGHAPADGWANEFVTISINYAPEPE